MNSPKELKIQWLVDTHDCDTCGISSAEGAIVSLDGQEILRLEPLAHCYNAIEFRQEDVYKKIFEHLGYTTVEIEPE